MVDITPELLETLEHEFNSRFNKSTKILIIQKKIKAGTATYVDAQAYSVEAGEILVKVFKEYIKADALPDGRMYYNIAERILTATLSNNHKLISVATLQIQELLNKKAGLGLKAVEVPLYQDKIKSIINRISNETNFNDISWILDEPVITFSQNIVDDTLKANVEFQGKSGMKPKVIRTVNGHDACKWCRSLSGIYNYPDVPRDVYKRHDRCRCSVEYDPGDNKKQDFRPSNWKTQEEKEQIEIRKNYGL